MKVTLLALFISLLVIGCAEDPEGNSPRAKQASVETPDLDDPEILNEIFADALDMLKAEKRENKGQVLLYKPGEQTPYTGWVKPPEDEEIRLLLQFKDGQAEGFSIAWNKSGQKLIHMSIKEQKQDGVTRQWYANGQKRSQEDWKADKFMTCVAWKPNGERCQHTNLRDGNGVVLTYEEDGEEDWLVIFSTYKDGEWVSKSDPHPIKVKSAKEMTEDIDNLLEKLEVGSSKTDYGLGSETLDQIIAVAIDFDSLHLNEGLFLDPQKEATYTGWAKWVWSSGHVKYLVRFKYGKQDGPSIWWYKNGHKQSEDNWKANTQDGLSITYYEDGTQRERTMWNNGKLMTAVAWKPDGEKCPSTKVMKGNGIVVRYNKDGSEEKRFTYQDGELVSLTQIEEKPPSERMENMNADALLGPLESNTADLEALLEGVDQLTSRFENGLLDAPEQLPSFALDSQNQITKPPAQSALPSSGSGSSEEIRALAKNHYFGRESAPDYKRSFALFTQLANSGDPEAARYLGIAYLRGKGVPKDNIKALQWFRVSSQRGDALAEKNVRMLESLGLDEPAIAYSLEPLKAIDLDDKETRDKIIAEATNLKNLEKRGEKGKELYYFPNEKTPHSGWSKEIHDNGRIESLIQVNEGKMSGLINSWYENGQKKAEGTFKDGKPDGLLIGWYKNGQKKGEGNNKNGKPDGVVTIWYENGQKMEERKYEKGKVLSAVVWKQNGEVCPVTNLKDGNGVIVDYRMDIKRGYPVTYKDGEIVRD